jgi:hypothetical protein
MVTAYPLNHGTISFAFAASPTPEIERVATLEHQQSEQQHGEVRKNPPTFHTAYFSGRRHPYSGAAQGKIPKL